MYLLFINGGYRGGFALEDLMKIIRSTGYYDINVAKPNSFSNEDNIINELISWEIGKAGYLDLGHKWRVVKVG